MDLVALKNYYLFKSDTTSIHIIIGYMICLRTYLILFLLPITSCHYKYQELDLKVENNLGGSINGLMLEYSTDYGDFYESGTTLIELQTNISNLEVYTFPTIELRYKSNDFFNIAFLLVNNDSPHSFYHEITVGDLEGLLDEENLKITLYEEIIIRSYSNEKTINGIICLTNDKFKIESY